MTKPMPRAQKKAAAEKRKAKKAKPDQAKADKAAADQANADAANDAEGGAGAGAGGPTAGSPKPAPTPNDQPNAAAKVAGAGKDGDEGETSPAKSASTPKKPIALTADDSPRISVCTVRGVKSRWRAGYQFGPEPVEIAIDDLSEDQAKALQADPQLVIELLGSS